MGRSALRVHAAVPGDCSVLWRILYSQDKIDDKFGGVDQLCGLGRQRSQRLLYVSKVFFHGVLCGGRPVQLASHLPGEAKSQGAHADAMCTAGKRQANLLPHSEVKSRKLHSISGARAAWCSAVLA